MEQKMAGVGGSTVPVGAHVLVCGASFAGLATAFWMQKLGYRVTIVEIAEALRKGGTPVDIKEGTIEVVRSMGLLSAVRARSLPARKTEFKNADNVTEAYLPAQPVVQDGPDEQYEIDRDELLEIMFEAVTARVEIVFGRSVVRLEDGSDAVTAWFADGSSQAFALVFGCDGMRSNTRRLVFGTATSLCTSWSITRFSRWFPRRSSRAIRPRSSALPAGRSC